MKIVGPKSQCIVTSHRSLSLFFLSFSLFFSFFSTFLSFSLLLYLFFFLFFFRAKSSYSSTAHTHSVLLLSFDSVFFLFCSFCSSPTGHSHANPSWEIIGVDLRSHTEKLHHALILLIATIVLVLQSGWSIEIGIYSNGESPLETIRNDSIWKLCCQHREQLRWKLVFYLEAFFFFFFSRGVP